MGGRGSSSSGKRSNTASAGQVKIKVGDIRPKQLDMPNLSGSSRQISYAQGILNRGYDNLGQAARNEERLFSELKNGATRDDPIYQRAQAYRAAQERYADQVKSLKRLGTMQASQIINQRTQLDRIARSLAEDEFRKRKLPLMDVSKYV